MSGKLFVVGTPIGNLGDMSPRAVETLSTVDFIAAEDTRVTIKLLNHFGIKKQMLSYHEHNKSERNSVISDRIISGETCALVTDAGMPAISDPGEDLVRYCHEKGIEVESVPGPSALITALAISGMPAGRFAFEGFLSVNKPGRAEHLESVKDDNHTLIFYEAPHKLAATLKDMYAVFGERRIALVKELTKIHETVELTTLSEANEKFKDGSAKGEYVIIIEPAPTKGKEVFTAEQAAQMARELIEGGMSPTAASKEAAKVCGIRKSEIYRQLIK